MPYDGPFKVIRRAEKFFETDVKAKTTVISIDRLKPAFLADEDTTQHNHPYSVTINSQKNKATKTVHFNN